jgi:hypothetical protein
MKTMPLLVLSGALALAAFAMARPAQAMPVAPLQQAATGVVPVYHRGNPHRRTRVTVYPRQYAAPGYGTPYYWDDPGQYPYVRGFGDRNPVPRANMRGCTVDLGYGRYERCD